jgi:hypothetical protein
MEYGNRLKFLRIITKNFQSKDYVGSSLMDDTWSNLRDKLEEYGVNVRDDRRDNNPIY